MSNDKAPIEDAVPDDAEETTTAKDDMVQDVPSNEKPSAGIKDAYQHYGPEESAKVNHWVMSIPMTSSSREEFGELHTEYGKYIWDENRQAKVTRDLDSYKNMLNATYRGCWLDNEYGTIFDRDDADWVQRIKGEHGAVSINKRTQPKSKNKSMSGPAALIRLQSSLGMGVPHEIPCVHSGLTLTVGKFTMTEVMSLNLMLYNRNMELGYDTHGYMYSGQDVRQYMDILDFILPHVMATNIKGWLQGDIGILKSLITVPDIHAIMTGTLTAIYPTGYPIAHQCKNSGTEKCNYEVSHTSKLNEKDWDVSGLLDFKRMLIIDNNRLSRNDVKFMKTIHTPEEILKQQEKLNKTDNLVSVTYNSVKFDFYLEPPHLDTYEDRGNRWINSIKDMVTTALNNYDEDDEDLRAETRSSYIRNYQSAVSLARQGCWIKSIQFLESPEDDEPCIVDDFDTISDYLEQLSDGVGLEDELVGKINQYREDVQFSFSALTNWVCPSCGDAQAEGLNAARGIIPINMVDYFLDLTVWRWGQHTDEKALIKNR